MGMTIEDIIDCFIRLKYAIEEGENNQNIDEVYPVLISFKKEHCIEVKEVVDSAITTMRKYQKIQEIIKDIPYGGDVTVRRIQEVLEDGNDD